ncbi:MAG: hypothetical protein ACHQX3_08605, partial [Nitrospirales bacterium]
MRETDYTREERIVRDETDRVRTPVRSSQEDFPSAELSGVTTGRFRSKSIERRDNDTERPLDRERERHSGARDKSKGDHGPIKPSRRKPSSNGTTLNVRNLEKELAMWRQEYRRELSELPET